VEHKVYSTEEREVQRKMNPSGGGKMTAQLPLVLGREVSCRHRVTIQGCEMNEDTRGQAKLKDVQSTRLS
jgi:hypothetical protein